MVQVLPPVPTFGEKLMDVLKESGSKVAEGLQRRHAQTALQHLLKEATPQGNAQIPNNAAPIPGNTPINPQKNLAIYQVAEEIYGPQGAAQLLNGVVKQQEGQEKEARVIRQEGRATAQKFLDKISDLRNTQADTDIAIDRIDDALDANDLKSFQNWIAERLDDPYLKTSSAAALESGVKEFFINDITRIKGARLNQFLEKQLYGAYQKAGNEKSANYKITEAMKTGADIRKKEVEISNRLQDQYEQSGKQLPGNFERLVYKELQPYIEEKEKDLIKTYKDINSNKYQSGRNFQRNAPEGSVAVISSSGERGYIPSDQLQEALKQGYKAA